MTPLAFISQLSEWWQSLDSIAQVLAGIGTLAGIATLVLLVLTVIGLDQGGITDALDVDVDTDVHGDGSLFSLRSVTAFFLGFGWTAYLVYKHSGNILFASLAGFAVGVVCMVIIYWIGKSMMKLQSDGTVDFAQAVGSTGTVYITIPPKRESTGQAQVTFKQRHEIINAVTDADTALSAGTNIRVKERLADKLFLVEPL